MAVIVALALLPLQVLAIAYAAGILVATSRRSPVADGSLAVGAITGLASGLAIYGVARAVGDIGSGIVLIVALMTCLLAVPAGVTAAWLLPGTEDTPELRTARMRQGLLAGTVAGAVCGLLLTLIVLGAVFMLVGGPLAGACVTGGALAAYHPRRSRPERSWAAGLFVLGRTR